MERAEITSLSSDLLEFVDKRTTASFRTILYKNKRIGKKYREFQDQASELHKEIRRRLGGTKETGDLVYEYESFEGLLAGIQIDQAYIQGLSDGLKLKKLLDRGIL